MAEQQPLRVVFMGTPAIAVPSLDALVADGQRVVAVVTQPDRAAGRGRRVAPSPVKEAAQRHGLTVLQPPSLRSPEVVEALRQLDPDAIVVAAFGQILRPAVLAVPRLGCLNVHPSLLPKLRGASPINFAILEGLPITGVTIMLMDRGMDTGPILTQVAEEIRPDDDAETLGRRLAAIGASLLVSTLHAWAEGRIAPRSQDDSQATYTRPLEREDGLVDWARPAAEIARRARAFYPWPGAYTHWDGKTLKLLRVRAEPAAPAAVAPGVVAGLDRGGRPGLLVATGEDVLAVERLQIEGRRPMSADEFVRGQPGIVGARLGAAASSGQD